MSINSCFLNQYELIQYISIPRELGDKFAALKIDSPLVLTRDKIKSVAQVALNATQYAFVGGIGPEVKGDIINLSAEGTIFRVYALNKEGNKNLDFSSFNLDSKYIESYNSEKVAYNIKYELAKETELVVKAFANVYDSISMSVRKDPYASTRDLPAVKTFETVTKQFAENLISLAGCQNQKPNTQTQTQTQAKPQYNYNVQYQ